MRYVVLEEIPAEKVSRRKNNNNNNNNKDSTESTKTIKIPM